MSEMVERVAGVIVENNMRLSWEEARDLARAAIEAMREPTIAMVKAGTISWDPMDGGPVRPMFEPTKPYQSMIDAALK